MSNKESKQSWVDRLTSVDEEVVDAQWHDRQMKKKFTIAGGIMLVTITFFILAAYAFPEVTAFITLTAVVVLAGGLATVILALQALAHNNMYMKLRD